MARPIKKGVDYFPLNTVMDDSVKLIEAEYGLTGFAVVVKLWMRIYSGFGYYCEWTNEVELLFKHENGLGGNSVSEIVASSIKRGIFNKEMFDKYHILTSSGIQKRYFEAVSRREIVYAEKRYLLIPVSNNVVFVDNNSVNVCRNSKNVDDNPQSKENKIKVNKSKVKESYGTFKNVLLTPSEYEDVFSWDNGATLNRFSEKLKSKGYKYQDHYAALLQWKAEDTHKTMPEHQRSYDMSEFERRANILPVYKGAD